MGRQPRRPSPAYRDIRFHQLHDAAATSATTPSITAGFNFDCALKGIDPGIAGNELPSNAGEVSDFGVSDVEPAMFKEPYNTENGEPQLTTSEVGRMQSVAVNQLMMGIVATNAVPATTTISRANYAAILQGRLTDWAKVDASLTGDNNAVVCRRVNGSGTQTSYNWFFNNFPCSQNEGGDVPPADVFTSNIIGGTGTASDPFLVDPRGAYTVVENSTSGDVRNCLSRANSLDNHTVNGSFDQEFKVLFKCNRPTASLTPAEVAECGGAGGTGNPFKAIGVLSLDSYASANPSGGGWSFRYLDGAGVYNANT